MAEAEEGKDSGVEKRELTGEPTGTPPSKKQKIEEAAKTEDAQESTAETTSAPTSESTDKKDVASELKPEAPPGSKPEGDGASAATDGSATPASGESKENPNPVSVSTIDPAPPVVAAPSAKAPLPAPAPAPTPAPAGFPPGLPTSQPQAIHHNVPPSYSSANAVVEERGEVSSLYVGRVIGKGGEMIRDLQARSGCRIDVDQNVPPGQPRVITYRGTRKTVDFAKQLVQMLCQENASEADLPLGEAKREYLVVPATSVGKIIGRGGEMIRELQSRSHAKIQVDHSGGGGNNQYEKQVTITGSDLSVSKAKEMVLFLVANPNHDAMQSINMLVEDKMHRGGVWGSGPPYPNLPSQGQNMQPSSGGHGYDQQYGYGGAPGGAQGYGAPAPAPYGGPPSYGGAAPVYQQQQPPQASYGQFGAAGGAEMEVFYAAKNFMGRIIGQKGVTINDLQRRSSCDIQINQDVPPGQDCEISIRGSRQGIETAKQMLREIIEIGPNHPYAGGNQGYEQSGYGQQGQPQYGRQQQGGYNQGGYGQGGYNQGSYNQAYQAPQTNAYAQPAPAPYQAPPSYPPPAAPVPEWKSAASPDGQVYYYNERTGATQWNKPAGMP